LRLLASVRAQFCTLSDAEESRWAQTARAGKEVLQFLSEGRYVANVIEGRVRIYRRREEASR
jgi:hypothetical protein